MRKSFQFLAMASILSATSTTREEYEGMGNLRDTPKPRKSRVPQTPKQVIPKGQQYFSFREDGTYTCYEKQGAMLKTECVFSCYALNAKNAIKKFNHFKASINHKGGLQQGQIVLPKYINLKRK